jgi:hypothetical protein
MLSWAAILGVSTAGGPPGAGNYFHSSTWATIRDGSGDILSSESIADSGKLQMLSAEETKAVTDDDPLWLVGAKWEDVLGQKQWLAAVRAETAGPTVVRSPPVGQPTDHPRPGGSGPPACAPCRSCTGHGTAWRTAATRSARPPVVASTGRMRAAGRRLRPLLLPPSPPPPSPVVPPPPPPSRQWQLTLIPHPSPLVEVAARREMRHSTGRSDPDGPWSQPHLLFTKNSIRRFVRSARAIF